jgi:hypothetical protein
MIRTDLTMPEYLTLEALSSGVAFRSSQPLPASCPI